MTKQQQLGPDGLEDNVDIIEINNTQETLTYNGKTYTGEQASNAAFLIRLAIQRLAEEKKLKNVERSKDSWQVEMIAKEEEAQT